jgi:predicted GIY-YIG superfamily endonuclease
MAEQTLYRFFDSNKQLLYVGISINAYERAKQHRKEKYWWEEVATITLTRYEHRQDVEEAERWAIKNEQPLYNKIHANPWYKLEPRPVPEQRKQLESLLDFYKIRLNNLERLVALKEQTYQDQDQYIKDLRSLLNLPKEIRKNHG